MAITHHRGIGSPFGKWTKRRYDKHGNVVVEEARVTKRDKAWGYQEFVSYGPTEADAKSLGLARTKDKGTVFESKRQLENYLAREKDHGRSTDWRGY